MPALVSWDPSALASAGETLAARAQDLQRSAGDLERVSRGIGADWSGAAGDAAVAHHERRTAEVDGLAADVHDAGKALRTAGDEIASARTQLTAALATAAAGGYAVSDSGAVRPPTLPEPPADLTGQRQAAWQREVDDIADYQARFANRLSAQIDAALTAADVADTTAGLALSRLVLPAISPPPTLSSGAALPAPAEGTWGLQVTLGSARLLAQLDLARAMGQTPAQYAELLTSYWQATALERAGIDPATWRPELGVDHNRATVMKVYEYYGDVFARDATMEWAGLANLVGPGFAGAFQDLDTARDVARRLADQPVLPPGVNREVLRATALMSDSELRFYETTFLTMQKDIFLDIGATHEAYLAGADNGLGMLNVQEMAEAGLVLPRTLAAWKTIDEGRRSGSARLLHEGAIRLADHEQNRVIADNWDAMREHSPGGAAVTYLMTVVGRPSVPMTRFPGQVRPVSLGHPGYLPESVDTPDRVPFLGLDLPERIPLPPDGVTIVTPLPDFNVSVREDRWDYFLEDTMPAYVRLLDEPGRHEMTAEIARPLENRVDEQRTWNRLPEILRHGITGWSLEVR